MKILLLEDDAVLGEILEEFLAESYEVERTFSSDAAFEMVQEGAFDLFVFDINVAGTQNGLELLGELRGFNNTTPAIVITAYSDVEHLKRAFGSGANDFIRKPFELEELRMRIENIKNIFHLDGVIPLDETTSFHPKRDMILKEGKSIRLSPKDAKILHYFLKNAGRAVSSEELMQNLWEYDAMPSEATLRSHIRTIRDILGKERIQTVRGVGYIYE